MKSAMQGFSKSIGDQSEYPAVNVPSFFMRRHSESSPLPTQYYHYHDCYELYYLHSGERYYFIKDKTYHVFNGAIVFIEPYTIHCSSNFEKNGYDRTVIYFKREFVEDFFGASEIASFDRYLSDCRIHNTDISDRTLIEAAIDSMQSVFDAGASDETYLKVALLHLLLLIAKNSTQNSLPPIEYANPTHRIISEVTGYINNHYRENITLASISEQFFISPCYFSRTFKSLCGLSFTEYLNNVRIKAARDLLTATDMNITEVAEATGFSVNTHFGRVFKKIVGVSPIKYRKKSG